MSTFCGESPLEGSYRRNLKAILKVCTVRRRREEGIVMLLELFDDGFV